MTSLASFPNLRRTITDIMEDELYSLPNSHNHHNHHLNSITTTTNKSVTSSPALQHTPLNSSTPTNLNLSNNPNGFYNSNNNSLSSLLNIPDSFIDQYSNYTGRDENSNNEVRTNQVSNQTSNHSQQHQHNNQFHSNNSHTHRSNNYYDIPDDEMYADIDEFDINPFNEYANPDLFTTNQPHNHPKNFLNEITEPPLTVSPKDAYLKFPEELMSYQNNDTNPNFFHNEIRNSNESDSKFFVWPINNQSNLNFNPDELFEEEISDDDIDEDDDLLYDLCDEDNDSMKFSTSSPSTSIGDDDESMIDDDDVYSPPSESKRKFRNNQLPSPEPTPINSCKSTPLSNKSSSLLNKSINSAKIKLEHSTDDIKSRFNSMVSKSSLNNLRSSNTGDLKNNNNHCVKNNTNNHYQHNLDNHTNQSNGQSINIDNENNNEVDYMDSKLSEFNNSESALDKNSSSHQCHLINPTTKRLCLKQFSRPYDLIRHQETIHAEKRKIFRCIICENENPKAAKTFSRGDALSRHIRVKHGLTGTNATNAINYAKQNVEYI